MRKVALLKDKQFEGADKDGNEITRKVPRDQIKVIGERKKAQENEDGEEYEVEFIFGEKIEGKERKFLVKWKGYDASESTWETKRQLKNSPQIMREYFQRKAMIEKTDAAKAEYNDEE